MKKIKFVGIWNPKGGQGKSMLAINLAAACVDLGIKPLVICRDQQGTSILFYKGGNLNFEVVDRPPEDRPDADVVFFDYQASDWELPTENLLVIPLKPARDQYATYIDALKRVENHKDKNSNKIIEHQIITVVTDGQAHRADENKTMSALKEKGAFIIPASGVFSRAAAEYRSIFDPKLNKAYKVNERRREISIILARVLLEQSEDKKYGTG